MAHSGRPFWYDKAFHLSRLHENLYMDLAGVPPQHLMTYFPKLESNADRILFGTDFPAQPKPLRSLIGIIEGLPLRPESIEKILGENARASTGFVEVKRNVTVRSRMLNRIVQEVCRTDGARAALVFVNERYTYAQLEEHIASLCSKLEEVGCRPRKGRGSGVEKQSRSSSSHFWRRPAWEVPRSWWTQVPRPASCGEYLRKTRLRWQCASPSRLRLSNKAVMRRDSAFRSIRAEETLAS